MEIQIQQEKLIYLVVIFGPPGSGKTTIAEQLLSSIITQTKKGRLNLQYALISADCCEQYIREHSQDHLEQIMKKQGGWSQLSCLKLKRSLFSQEVWKSSRNFIKNSLPAWLRKWNIVILQDDLLLKSQRKQMRQLAQHTNIYYIQLFQPLTYQQCMANLKNRESELNKEEHISNQKARQCYQKFEVDDNPYCEKIYCTKDLSWRFIQQKAKKVFIEHPEMKQKLPVCEQNVAKNTVEVQIRNFITELMTEQETRKKYFGEKDVKDVAIYISKLKKGYKGKNKSLEGFMAYFQKETAKMI